MEPVERFFVGVLVVNGTTEGQRLPPITNRLNFIGYFDVRGVVGAVPATETILYFAEGYENEANVVGVDLGYELGTATVLPFEEAPPVSGIGTAKVIVYLGPDDLPYALEEQAAEEG